MAWLLMSLRRSELTRSMNQHTYEKLQLSRQIRKLSSFSNAIGDGKIMPSEIAGLDSELFGEALDFMGYSTQAAEEIAYGKTQDYERAFNWVTAEQYANNPALAAQAELYFDPETGSLDTSEMYEKFYEEALKEYAEKVITPKLKEKEEELEDKKNELETLVELEKAELDEIKNSISSEIQNSTIKLS